MSEMEYGSDEHLDGLSRDALKAEVRWWHGRALEMEAENAKLRELVQKMMRFFEDGDWCTICELVKECEAQEQYDEDCLMRGIFHDRMRELGVEV